MASYSILQPDLSLEGPAAFNWFTYEHPEPLNWQLNPT